MQCSSCRHLAHAVAGIHIHVSRLWHQPHMALDAIAVHIQLPQIFHLQSTVPMYQLVTFTFVSSPRTNPLSLIMKVWTELSKLGLAVKKFDSGETKLNLHIAISEWLIKPHKKRTSNTVINLDVSFSGDGSRQEELLPGNVATDSQEDKPV